MMRQGGIGTEKRERIKAGVFAVSCNAGRQIRIRFQNILLFSGKG
jgi:hypothetical protein